MRENIPAVPELSSFPSTTNLDFKLNIQNVGIW